jgi:hypothetical protein
VAAHGSGEDRISVTRHGVVSPVGRPSCCSGVVGMTTGLITEPVMSTTPAAGSGTSGKTLVQRVGVPSSTGTSNVARMGRNGVRGGTRTLTTRLELNDGAASHAVTPGVLRFAEGPLGTAGRASMRLTSEGSGRPRPNGLERLSTARRTGGEAGRGSHVQVFWTWLKFCSNRRINSAT